MRQSGKLGDPKVRFENGYLEVQLEYGHVNLRAHLKSHGFKFINWPWWRFPDPARLFSADADAIASEFATQGYQHVASELRALILRHGRDQAARISKSRKAASESVHPAPEGLSYLPFQIAGIDYMLEHKRVLLADQMGLGKTIQILGLINAAPSIRHALIVVPASLRQNWIREARKWLVRPFTVWDGSEIRHRYDNDPKTKEMTWRIGRYHDGSAEADHEARVRDEYLAWRLPDSLVVASYEDVVTMVHPVRKVSLLLDPGWMIAPQPPVIDREGLMPAKRRPQWDLFAIDEAHALKAQSATRSKVILGGQPHLQGIAAKESRYCVLATGTPIVNKPVELYKLVNNLDPQFMRYDDFKRRFCAPKEVRRGGKTIVVADGADNLAELDRRLRSTVMLRRLKLQVLKELPPKVRKIVTVPDDGCLEAAKDTYATYLTSKRKLEEAALSDETKEAFATAGIDFGDYCELITEIEDLRFVCSEFRQDAREKPAGVDWIPSEAAIEAEEALSEAALRLEALHARLPAAWVAQGGIASNAEIQRILVEMLRNLGKARKEVGLGKLSAAIERVRAIAAEEKVVVFAHHQEVINPLFKAFGARAVLIDGSIAPDLRLEHVNKFQEDPKLRVAVVSIKAGGVGLTLTAAKRLVMAELDWTPAGIEQAEDRIHRIGQTGTAQIDWLYGGDGTADAHIRALVERKERIIAEGLGDEVDWLPDSLAEHRASTPVQKTAPPVTKAQSAPRTGAPGAIVPSRDPDTPFRRKADGTARQRKPGPGRPRLHDGDPDAAKERARSRAKQWRQENKARATEAKRRWRAKTAEM